MNVYKIMKKKKYGGNVAPKCHRSIEYVVACQLIILLCYEPFYQLLLVFYDFSNLKFNVITYTFW